jgi:hypothetical protein
MIKTHFLKVFRNVRVLDRYALIISRCVRLKDCTISSLKSHYNHVMMQQLLPIALRGSLTQEDMDRLERGICVTLCKMEYIFLPSFFAIMVNLVGHLVHECQLGWPVQYMWMYLEERYNLFTFTHDVIFFSIIRQ